MDLKAKIRRKRLKRQGQDSQMLKTGMRQGHGRALGPKSEQDANSYIFWDGCGKNWHRLMTVPRKTSGGGRRRTEIDGNRMN